MKKKILIFLLIIVFLGAFLRFYRIDFLSLWYDEVTYMGQAKNFYDYLPYYYKEGYYDNYSSFLYSQFSIHTLGTGQPLYFPIMNFWINVFGDGEIALRSFSAICGILSIIFIFLIARLLFNNRIALLSAFLLAINPYNIAYSQEATYYTLFVLFAILSMYYFVKSIKENKWIYWILYSVFTVLGVYTHTFFLLILFTQLVFFGLSNISRKRTTTIGLLIEEGFAIKINYYKKCKKRFLISLFIMFILYLPWLVPFVYASLYALEECWILTTSWIDFPGTIIVFGIGQTLVVKESPLYLLILVCLIFLFGFCYPLLCGMLKGKGESRAILTLWMILPVLITFLVSILVRPMFMWTYVMCSMPAFVILIANGLSKLIKKEFIICLLIIIGLSSASLIHYYSTPIFKGDWRAATDFIEKNEREGDIIIVHSPQVINTLKYYYRGNLPIKGFPDIPEEQLNTTNIKATEKNINTLDNLTNGYNRIWLVQRLVKDKEKTIPDYLDKKYTRISFNKFVWVRVYQYEMQ